MPSVEMTSMGTVSDFSVQVYWSDFRRPFRETPPLEVTSTGDVSCFSMQVYWPILERGIFEILP